MKTAEKPRSSTPVLAPRPQVVPLALSPSSKITPAHLDRLAILYMRQSSPKQVLQNRESTERQYNFAEQAVAFGWPRERVLTIDEDLGKSGRTTEGRDGFQHLVTEVTLNHVGMVLGLEMSRLARSSKDWHAFFEMCAIFGTLITDEDGVYDGNDPNDRLLLGLKGIMSEMELHMMRNRLQHGRLNKARRGDLFFSVPLGYVKLSNGKVDLDPDEQARAVVRLLFEKYDELGTVHALFFWMIEHGISLPIRPRRGAHTGQLEWRRPSLATLIQTLHHPIYAGAYSYGRRPQEFKTGYASGKSQKAKWLPPDQWEVLIRDHLPAYITWEQYLKNQERLKQNQPRPDTPGAPRKGCALLPGLLVCGHCGWRMQVHYHIKNHPFYRCMHHHLTASAKTCFGITGNVLDELVSGQVLRALEPAALELSLKARADLRRERERLDKHWKQKLQRARYDVEMAERRYQAVDPANRLVAATLERQWEDALQNERGIKEEYDRHCRQTLPQLSADDEARITALASDIPALWHSPTTTNAERQAIVRCLIERVVVDIEPNSEDTMATIHWIGGFESRHEFARPVRTYDQLQEGDLLMKRLVELREAGKTAEQTADTLNAEGFASINPSKKFNREITRKLLLKLGLYGERNDDSLLAPGEWWVRDLADKVEIPWQTLREWAVNGWVHGRQTNVEKLWIMWADTDEMKRLRKLRSARSRGILGYPKALTTPKHLPRE
jgi:DNA invertase Pin-like site-specific DNA recombinase